jgi:hypothetical protein
LSDMTQQFIENALVETEICTTLKTLNMLCTGVLDFVDANAASPLGSGEPFVLPALKHLTLSPRIQSISNLRVLWLWLGIFAHRPR